MFENTSDMRNIPNTHLPWPFCPLLRPAKHRTGEAAGARRGAKPPEIGFVERLQRCDGGLWQWPGVGGGQDLFQMIEFRQPDYGAGQIRLGQGETKAGLRPRSVRLAKGGEDLTGAQFFVGDFAA